MAKTLDQYPELMTVDEAAEYLRVSRSLGYQLARQYRDTHGATGLPVVNLGRCLRVPRKLLAVYIAGGETAAPPRG
jgi:excisionase family DNA binding protein